MLFLPLKTGWGAVTNSQGVLPCRLAPFGPSSSIHTNSRGSGAAGFFLVAGAFGSALTAGALVSTLVSALVSVGTVSSVFVFAVGFSPGWVGSAGIFTGGGAAGSLYSASALLSASPIRFFRS